MCVCVCGERGCLYLFVWGGGRGGGVSVQGFADNLHESGVQGVPVVTITSITISISEPIESVSSGVISLVPLSRSLRTTSMRAECTGP